MKIFKNKKNQNLWICKKNEDLQANLKAAAEERETLQRNLDETSEENRQLTLDLGNLKYEYHAVQDNLEIAMREQYELQLKFDKDLKEAMENIQMVSVERDIALEDIRQKDNAIETLENEKKEELLRATAAVEQKGEEVKLKVKEIYDLKIESACSRFAVELLYEKRGNNPAGIRKRKSG